MRAYRCLRIAVPAFSRHRAMRVLRKGAMFCPVACLQSARRNKAGARCISHEYTRLKATYKRRCEEMREMQSTIDRLRAGSASASDGVAATAPAVVTRAGGDVAARRPPTSQSHHSEGGVSGSEQLHGSEQGKSAVRRLASISNSEAEQAHTTHHTSGQPTQEQEQLVQRTCSSQQRRQDEQHCTGSAEISPQASFRPVPHAMADPLHIAAPPADDAWPAEKLPAKAAAGCDALPTAADSLLADIGEPGGGGEEGVGAGDDEDVELTQAVPPPTAPVVCSPCPPLRQQRHTGHVPPLLLPQQHQPQHEREGVENVQVQALQPPSRPQAGASHQQQPEQQQQPQQDGWHVQQEAGCGAFSGSHRKRPAIEPAAALAADRAAGTGQPMPPPQPKRRHAGSNDSAPRFVELQEGCQQQRRQRQGRQADDEPTLPVAEPFVEAAASGKQQQQPTQNISQVAAAPWPTAAQQALQQQQQPGQMAPNGGWKSAVRTTAAAHAAFELGVDGRVPALQRGQALQHSSGAQAAARPEGAGRYRYIPPGEPGYKYQAVVRKRAEREKLEVRSAAGWVRRWGAWRERMEGA